MPTKKQWFAESIYGFVRNNIAVDMIGHAGVRFAPYFTTLFCFILLTNLFAHHPVLPDLAELAHRLPGRSSR